MRNVEKSRVFWGTLSYLGNTFGEAAGADREMGSEQDPPDRMADSVVSRSTGPDGGRQGLSGEICAFRGAEHLAALAYKRLQI